MEKLPVVIIHKDHLLDPRGVNAGAETATIALANALAAKGHRVFLGAVIPSHYGEVFVDGNVCYLNLTSAYDTSSVFRRLKKDFSLRRYGLIVSCRAKALIESLEIAEVSKRIFISHEPSAQALGEKPAQICAVSDAVVAVSQAQKEDLIAAGGNREKIKVIRNGADLQLFKPGDIEQRDFRRLIFAGALVLDKGVHHLIEAFANLRTNNSDLRLDVYGSAAMWGRDTYFDLKVAESVPGVSLHGAVSQRILAEAYQTAGLLVLPSIFFDSFPLTVVEAQVSGLPVLGSNKGGMREIIINGVTGRLMENISSEELTRYLEEMLLDEQALRKMSRESLRQIRPQYSWEQTAKEFLSLLNDDESSKGISVHNISQSNHSKGNKEDDTCRTAILSPFNQACGLATYASYIVEQMPEALIFAEDVSLAEIVGNDGGNVRRCWKRGGGDFNNLESAIDELEIKILHLNCHPRFFKMPEFGNFLKKKRGQGLKIVSHVHNPFSKDSALCSLLAESDAVIVHKEENRLEIIASGGDPERIFVIEHGVKVLDSKRNCEAASDPAFEAGSKNVVCFGFVQPHKGLESVIEAVSKLSLSHPDIRLHIVGTAHAEDPQGKSYLALLKKLVVDSKLDRIVTFYDSFVPEDVVNGFLRSADAVVMNYQSNHYEASGAVARALGCGARVITSTSPAFSSLGSATFKVTTGFPLASAIEEVLYNKPVSRELELRGKQYSEKHSWSNTVARFKEIYSILSNSSESQLAGKARIDNQATSDPSLKHNSPKSLIKILMQIRGNAKSHPGGDSVLMERLANGLRKLGIEVDIDVLGNTELKNYDLIHLFNFATPDLTEAFARRANQTSVPYVVTTLYEDLPIFKNQMFRLFDVFAEYVKHGQSKDLWNRLFPSITEVPPSEPWKNMWTAEHAEMLFATGNLEKENLITEYPGAGSIECVCLGSEVHQGYVDPGMFEKEYGVKDFVLCVGRLETRKNQLMILRALEDSELPVVLVGGGVCYQPEYEALCRQYKRIGPTIITGRLSNEMLASAYSAARIHVLPSWYELPGLVTLEAARYGSNVVVSDHGTIRDYLGDLAYYSKPYDADGLREAIIAAYYAPIKKGLKERAESFSWEKTVEQTLSLYQTVLRKKGKTLRADYDLPEWTDNESSANTATGIVDHSIQEVSEQAGEASAAVMQIPRMINQCPGKDAVTSNRESEVSQVNPVYVQQLCDEADKLAREGDLDAAFSKYNQAIGYDNSLSRPFRSCGVIAIQRNKYQVALEYFERALRIDEHDLKAKTGVGAVLAATGKQEEAFGIYEEVLDKDPSQIGTLVHLLHLAYPLGKLAELETRLFKYLQVDESNNDMRFSLAGCYYKQGKITEATGEIEKILKSSPGYEHALSLLELIKKEALSVQDQEEPGHIAEQKHSIQSNSGSSIESRIAELEEEKARKNYEQVISQSKDIVNAVDASAEQIAQALILQAEALACQGELQEAEILFKRLEDSKSIAYRALAGRGALAAATGDFSNAEAFFHRSLARMPEFDVAIAGLGMCAVERGDLNSGWNLYNQALDKEPENTRALHGVIDLGYKLNRLTEMEARISKYIEYHPGNLSMLYSLAGCFFAQGRYEEADKKLDEVLLFSPGHTLALELKKEIAGLLMKSVQSP